PSFASTTLTLSTLPVNPGSLYVARRAAAPERPPPETALYVLSYYRTAAAALGRTMSLTPSMAATSTSSPVGMGWPLALRAVQVLPSTYNASAALSLSMPSVTFASIPRRRSVLVGITRVPTRRRVSGRIRSRETMDSRRNISSWASGETPAAAAINAPTAPMVNQIETRAVVAISATSVTTATPPQSQ